MDGAVRLFLSLFIFGISGVVTEKRTLPMKIVDEPSQYGYNANSNNNFMGANEDTLKMRVDPSPFSGPRHLRRLMNKCFNLTDENYKYEFCPFSNVTQHEQSFRWNPYSGVLGVWQEWDIVNTSFTGMWMRNGDDCGLTKRREVKVILKCGKKNEVKSVTEPRTCSYELVFKTPLVCHNHSLLVYPTLNESLRHDWDMAYSNFRYGYTTQQGYKKEMKKVFEKAGYYVSNEKKQLVSKTEEKKDEQKNVDPLEDNYPFSYAMKCNVEYKKVKDENDQLREELHELRKRLNDRKTVGNHRGAQIQYEYDDLSDPGD